MREIIIQTGFSGMIIWNIAMEQARLNNRVPLLGQIRYKDYLIFTPYYKGNIYKLWATLDGTYRVYYGTRLICFATSLQSALTEIPEYRDLKHEAWIKKNGHLNVRSRKRYAPKS